MVKGRCAAYAADRGPEMTLTSELPGRMARLACLFGLLGLLSGCVVYSVADTAVRVTDDEIRRYFDAHRDDFGDRRGRAVLSLITTWSSVRTSPLVVSRAYRAPPPP